MWLALISIAKNSAVSDPPNQYLPLSVKIILVNIGAKKAIANAWLAWPATNKIILYYENVKQKHRQQQAMG